MAGLLDELKNVLEEEYSYYEKFLEHANAKRDLIIKNEVEEISDINSKEQLLISLYAKVAKKRDKTIDDISIVLNIDRKNLTIKSLMEKLPKEEKEKLEDVSERTRDIVGVLKDANLKNELLIKQSLEYVEFTLNAVTSSNEQVTSPYQKKGNFNYNVEGNANFFDTSS